MTPHDAEAIVRRVWPHKADYCGTSLKPIRIFGYSEVNYFLNWNDALVFTREHLRKIAALKLAIETAFCADPINCATCEITKPVRDLAENALAALRNGVRKEYQDGSTEEL